MNQTTGSETAVAFFISLVSAILEKPVLDRTVVLGEMSVQGMLLKVASLPERMQLAVTYSNDFYRTKIAVTDVSFYLPTR